MVLLVPFGVALAVAAAILPVPLAQSLPEQKHGGVLQQSPPRRVTDYNPLGPGNALEWCVSILLF